MKWFKRKPKNYGDDRYLVRLRGGATTIKGQETKGFYAYRLARASTLDEVKAQSIANLIEEFNENGIVTNTEEIRVQSTWKQKPTEPDPKEYETHFWKEEEDRTAVFDEFEKWLRQYNLWVEREPHKVIVRNHIPGQFDVELEYEDEEFTLTAAAWHTHFEEDDQATACFRWLLTPFYRIVEERRDDVILGAWIERWEKGGWNPLHPYISYKAVHLMKGEGTFEVSFKQQALLDPGNYAKMMKGAVLDDNGMPPGSHIGTRTETRSTSLIAELELIPQETLDDMASSHD